MSTLYRIEIKIPERIREHGVRRDNSKDAAGNLLTQYDKISIFIQFEVQILQDDISDQPCTILHRTNDKHAVRHSGFQVDLNSEWMRIPKRSRS